MIQQQLHHCDIGIDARVHQWRFAMSVNGAYKLIVSAQKLGDESAISGTNGRE